MRASDWEIFFSSLRSRSRVRSSRACSSSIVARSAGSGTMEVSSRRCSVVSPALLSRSSLSVCSLTRKNSSCLSFMYSESGMASTSASVRSRPALAFQALTSLGSALWADLVTSIRIGSTDRAGGRGGAKRSAKREVAGGTGAGEDAAADARAAADILGWGVLTGLACSGAGAGTAGLVTATGLTGSGAGAALTAGLAGADLTGAALADGLATGFAEGLATGFGAVLAAGLAVLTGALAAGFGLATGFEAALAAGFLAA